MQRDDADEVGANTDGRAPYGSPDWHLHAARVGGVSPHAYRLDDPRANGPQRQRQGLLHARQSGVAVQRDGHGTPAARRHRGRGLAAFRGLLKIGCVRVASGFVWLRLSPPSA